MERIAEAEELGEAVGKMSKANDKSQQKKASGRLDRRDRAAWWLRRHFAQILVLALVAGVLLAFIWQKEGYHMDELLSYELANARFNPWIVPTQPQGRLEKLYENEIEGDSLGETLGNAWRLGMDLARNRGDSLVANYQADVYDEPVWISGEAFRDYITVDHDDAFNYLSVYFNVKDDNHPPLHFMALHTVSSLFQGKATPLMGCAINEAAILGCCLLFMKLGGKLGRKEIGLAAALLYGVSSGAIATALLIRMYGMMTFWCVATFTIHLCKWQDQDWRKHNGWLIAVTALGFWTQYFFLFYCISLALVTIVALARKREWKSLFGYIRSMAIAAVIGLAVFPFAVSDVFSSGRGVEALGNLAEGFKGYGVRLLAFGKLFLTGVFGNPYGAATVCILFLVAVYATHVSRVSLRLRGKEDQRVKRVVREKGGPKEGLPGFYWVALLIPVLLYFLLAARMSPYLVDRYIMAIFPFAALACATLLFEFTDVRLAALLTVFLGAFSLFSYSGEYLYTGYGEQLSAAKEVSEQYGGISCICLYDGVGYYENLLEFAEYDETLLLTLDELKNRKDKESILEKDKLIVLVKQMDDALSVNQVLQEEYGLQFKSFLANGVSPYGDHVMLYER